MENSLKLFTVGNLADAFNSQKTNHIALMPLRFNILSHMYLSVGHPCGVSSQPLTLLYIL